MDTRNLIFHEDDTVSYGEVFQKVAMIPVLYARAKWYEFRNTRLEANVAKLEALENELEERAMQALVEGKISPKEYLEMTNN